MQLRDGTILALEPEAIAVVKEQRRQTLPERLEEVLDDTLLYFMRYVRFTTSAQAVAVTLWTVYTHCFGVGQAYSWVPYLLVTSAEPSSGKTTLLDLVARLAYEPLRAESMTPAYVGRSAGGKTLLLDEVDGIYKGRVTDGDGAAMDLRSILNGGFNVRGTYSRLIPVKGGGYEPKEWPTFGPKYLTGIGRDVPDTVKSRSIRIRLERKAPGIEVERARDRFVNRVAEPLRVRIVDIAAELGELPFVDELPEGLADRDQDIWEPLVALADQASGQWGAMAREAAVTLSKTELSYSTGLWLLSDLRDLFEAEEWPPFMATNAIIGVPVDTYSHFDATGLCASEHVAWSAWSKGKPITSHALAKLLGDYDVKSGRETVGGHGYGPSGYFLADLMPKWRTFFPTCELPPGR
jgi:hypothetical protein